MDQTHFCVLLTSLCLLVHTTDSAAKDDVKNSLINFLAKLNGTTGLPDPSFGWSSATDPCQGGGWKGVTCDGDTVTDITLTGSSLSGVFDAGSLCNVQPLAMFLTKIRLEDNFIGGQLPAEVSNCKYLTFLLIGNNQFSGNLPNTLSRLGNLKRLDISNNNFSGNLPALSSISGLKIFLAEHNQLTGKIPNFDFSNLDRFNVSFNNFGGPIPDTKGRFDESNFLNNPKLCGPPLSKPCSPSDPNMPTMLDVAGGDSKGKSKNDILMYSGYVVLGLVFIAIIVIRIFKRKKRKELDPKSKVDTESKVVSNDDSFNEPSARSSVYNTGANRSEFSFDSYDSTFVSTSLMVLTSPVVNGLKFDDLLKAPAELLGRGKHCSLYMVTLENRIPLAVKRIKDWAISRSDFKQRMHKLSQVKHPNVLSPLAFYSSIQEKLLVYEYQQNGSLLKLIHGIQMGRIFDWGSRLDVVATIAEALAFMHQKLCEDGIAHGNLKSSNILLDKKMEPCISEYGLMVVENREYSKFANGHAFRGTQRPVTSSSNAFEADIYGFGVILLELLTGKLAHTDGMDLASWVQAVVREEWTAEVFDKSLILEGASEDRMVNLLRVAIKCTDQSPEDRPKMNRVANMINTIKEEEERSGAMSTETPNTSI